MGDWAQGRMKLAGMQGMGGAAREGSVALTLCLHGACTACEASMHAAHSGWGLG